MSQPPPMPPQARQQHPRQQHSGRPAASPEAAAMQRAAIHWRDAQPVSDDYDDVYFSDHVSDGGFAEATHIFIKGNELPARFRHLENGPPDAAFSICELGFGTGLNTVSLAAEWRRRGHTRGHLHLVSIEGFPLSPADFRQAQNLLCAANPAIHPISTDLVRAYPPLTRGQYVIPLADDITLTLVWAEISAALTGLEGQFDAWLPDGFSPAKNPLMWAPDVFGQIARLSHPGSTAATFSVAGIVKRGFAAAGYAVSKQPGFGRKREMLVAHNARRAPPDTAPPDTAPPDTAPPDTDAAGVPASAAPGQGAPFRATSSGQPASGQPTSGQPTSDVPAPGRPARQIFIVGAGIAGSALAYHLRRLGANPVLIDKAGPASGASGNPAGLVMPRLDLPASPACHFYRQAYLYTVRLLEMIADEIPDRRHAPGLDPLAGARSNPKTDDTFCERALDPLAGARSNPKTDDTFCERALFRQIGGEKRPKNQPEKARHMALNDAATLPASDMAVLPDAQLFFPRAGLVCPPALIAHLVRHIDIIKDTVIRYEKTADGWRIYGKNNQYQADVVVITAGAGSIGLYPDPARPLCASRGQVDIFATPRMPATILAQGQYCAPLSPGTIIAGATYEDASPDSDVGQDMKSTTENQAAAARLLDLAIDGLHPLAARASLRCAASDYNPVSGPLPMSLPDSVCLPDSASFPEGRQAGKTPQDRPATQGKSYILSGLGSRGLVTAPYLADDLARLVTGAPGLLTKQERDLVCPSRFARRPLKG